MLIILMIAYLTYFTLEIQEERKQYEDQIQHLAISTTFDRLCHSMYKAFDCNPEKLTEVQISATLANGHRLETALDLCREAYSNPEMTASECMDTCAFCKK
ncbi:MAG: hypothetical protein JW727_01025 [Candidatus Aenigmarchaeota archaeon]|nr:hypothetical protein [Candidatus Aenigmarchaeota archaeon]